MRLNGARNSANESRVLERRIHHNAQIDFSKLIGNQNEAIHPSNGFLNKARRIL